MFFTSLRAGPGRGQKIAGRAEIFGPVHRAGHSTVPIVNERIDKGKRGVRAVVNQSLLWGCVNHGLECSNSRKVEIRQNQYQIRAWDL
jgi:hypothetical protein